MDRQTQPKTATISKRRARFILDAQGNYLHAPGRFHSCPWGQRPGGCGDDDALLVTTLGGAQDVGKIVSFLDAKKMTTTSLRNVHGLQRITGELPPGAAMMARPSLRVPSNQVRTDGGRAIMRRRFYL